MGRGLLKFPRNPPWVGRGITVWPGLARFSGHAVFGTQFGPSFSIADLRLNADILWRAAEET